MEVCVMCKRKVEPTENWIKAHLWGGFGIFHWICFGSSCAQGARNRSRARSGKRTVWRKRIKPPNRREQEGEVLCH
jgi:hypothetical protein